MLNCPTCSPMGKGPHRAFREVAMKNRLTLYLRGVSAGAMATIFLATPVVAQDVTGGAPAAASGESEAIVVTGTRIRSEEHTSGLQSLMRISYAVFCLKKKKQTNHNI